MARAATRLIRPRPAIAGRRREPVMHRTRLSPSVWAVLLALVSPAGMSVFAAEPQSRADNARSFGSRSVVVPSRGATGASNAAGAAAAPRSFGRSAAADNAARGITVSRGGTIVRGGSATADVRASAAPVGVIRTSSSTPRISAAPVVSAVQPAVAVNPVSGASRRGDGGPGIVTRGMSNGAAVVAGASRANDRATGTITRGSWSTSAGVAGASRAGDGTPGTINRGASLQPSPPYGGVTVNRGGVVVNPAQGGVRPEEPSSPPSPPIDPDSIWYKRYRDRWKVYDPRGRWPSGHWWYPYPNYPYFLDVNTLNWTTVSPPMIINEIQAPPQPAAAEKTPEPVQEPEPLPVQQEEPRRRGSGLTPEKLDELMAKGVQLFEQGKYNEAASTFLRVTLADRQNIDATLAYAMARFATGDYQIAALAIRRGVRRLPDVVDSGFDLRARYGNLAEFEQHLARLEEYVRQEPGAVDGWIVLGFVRHFSGQQELAAETFRRLKNLPGADVGLADIFLSARTADGTSASAAPARQPADASPMVLPASDRPLPPVDDRPLLISVEAVE